MRKGLIGVTLAVIAGSAVSAWAGPAPAGREISLSAGQWDRLELALDLSDADRGAIRAGRALGLDFAPLDRPGVTERSGFVAVQVKSPAALGLMLARERAASGLRAPSPASALGGLVRDRLERARARLAPSLVRSFEDIDEHRVRVPEGMSEEAFAEALLATGDYVYVEPDWTVFPLSTTPNDAEFSLQYHHGAAQLNTVGAWDLVTGGPGTIIGTADTGIKTNHADLAASIVDGYNGVDKLSVAEGGDISDINGHGTGATGCAAAIGNNGIGVAGMGWQFGIIHARVTNDPGGGAAITAIKQSVRWISDHGASSISVSYSGVDTGQLGQTGARIEEEGHQLFWASGNDGVQMVEPVPDEIVVVGAVGISGTRVGFSNYGDQLDLMAHGSNVRSTSWNGGYTWFGGTSAAAPLANGAGALLYAANPDLSPPQIREILYETATDIGAAGYDIYNGWGRINAGAAVAAALTGDFTTPIPFADDFDAPAINTARWTGLAAAALTSAGVNEPSGSNSLGFAQAGSIETVRLGGASAPGDAGVSFFIEPAGVEAGDSFVVEYDNGSGSWTPLTTLVADGSSPDEYRWAGARLPGGLTDELRLRLRAGGNDADDTWFVDDVAIDALPSVSVPWMETFEAPTDTALVWPTFGATRSSAQADTGSYAAALGAGQAMETGAIDASAFATGGDAYVSFRVKAVGVGAGQGLTAEVRDATGAWVPLATVPSDGVDDAGFTLYEAPFDAAWVSADAGLRFSRGAGAGSWYVDNVYVGPTSFATGCSPADLDGNGTINLDDLDAFIAAFLAGDPAADLDGSGTVNLDDLDAFIAAFLAGCP